MGLVKKTKKTFGKGLKRLKAPLKKGRKFEKGFFPGTGNNMTVLVIAALIVGGLVVVSAMQPYWAATTTDITTTTTTTDTTTYPTDTTTTTPPVEELYYVKLSFLWSVGIPDEEKVWVEFHVYDYHDLTVEGKRDQVTLGAGHGETGAWFYGAWNEEFIQGESLSIRMDSWGGWYKLPAPFYVDVTVGPWSNSFTFYSYKDGFNAALTGELRVTWELI